MAGRGGSKRAAPNPKGPTQCLCCLKSRVSTSKAIDIEAGEIVTIKEVCDEKVGVSKEEMSVIYFDEYDRGVILNKTNILALVKDLGDDEDDLARSQGCFDDSASSQSFDR